MLSVNAELMPLPLTVVICTVNDSTESDKH